jgi:hypothetical protein
MGRAAEWGLCLAAAIVPLLLLNTVGLPETWAAFRRYTNALLAYSEEHPLRVPKPGDKIRDYDTLDSDLMAWHAGFGALVDRASSMAVVRLGWGAPCAECIAPQLVPSTWPLNVASFTSRKQVGLMTDGDLGLELEFNAAAGSDKRALKSQLYAPRDITLLAYLLLSMAIFMTRALPLSALVLVLNICNLSVCLALKGKPAVWPRCGRFVGRYGLSSRLGCMHGRAHALSVQPCPGTC